MSLNFDPRFTQVRERILETDEKVGELLLDL